jgi:hypothetical protein
MTAEALGIAAEPAARTTILGLEADILRLESYLGRQEGLRGLERA